MQSVEPPHVTFDQILLCHTKGLATDMRHEYTWYCHVTPAQVAGANTEVVFLPIALSELIFTKQASQR